jgi:hypothetical protein
MVPGIYLTLLFGSCNEGVCISSLLLRELSDHFCNSFFVSESCPPYPSARRKPWRFHFIPFEWRVRFPPLPLLHPFCLMSALSFLKDPSEQRVGPLKKAHRFLFSLFILTWVPLALTWSAWSKVLFITHSVLLCIVTHTRRRARAHANAQTQTRARTHRHTHAHTRTHTTSEYNSCH